MLFKILNIDFIKLQSTYLISSVILVFIIVDVLQDFIHAVIYNEGFYLSESLIFKSFWILVPPLSIFISFLYRKKLFKLNIILGFKLLLISILHIFISALIIIGLYALILKIDFLFLDVFKEMLTTKLPLSLLIFGILTFIISTRKRELKSEFENKIKSHLDIKDGKTIYKIAVDKILFIEANTPYLSIKTENRKYVYNSSLSKFLSLINNPNFIRIHKKYIVNQNAILKLVSRANGDYDVILKNNDKIRLSRTYRKNTFSILSKNSIETK